MPDARVMDEPTRVPLTAGQWWALALCALAVFFDGYDAQMLAMAIPLMANEFHVVPTAFAAAASGSLAGMALGAMLLSPLADRFGRRPMLIASLLLFGLATLGGMHSSGPVEMAAWRVVAGCGLGATLPITIAVAADLAPVRRRVALVTMMASGFAIGASSAGQLAPFLSAWWGWRGLFGFGGFLPLGIALLCFWGIPASRPGTALAGAGRQAAARMSVLFTARYRHRTVLLWCLNAINLFTNYGLASWLPTLLIQNGWTLSAASRVTSLLAVGGVTGSYLVSTLVDRGRTVLALVGAYAIAAAALALCATNPGGIWPWVALVTLIGFGVIGPQLTLGPLASTYYPGDLRSTGVGWANGFGRAASLFGPLALAWLMRSAVSPTMVLGALMIPMVLCLVCSTLLPAALRAGTGAPGPRAPAP